MSSFSDDYLEPVVEAIREMRETLAGVIDKNEPIQSLCERIEVLTEVIDYARRQENEQATHYLLDNLDTLHSVASGKPSFHEMTAEQRSVLRVLATHWMLRTSVEQMEAERADLRQEIDSRADFAG